MRRRPGNIAAEVQESVEPEKKPFQTSVRWSTAVCWSLIATVIILPIIVCLLPSPVDPVFFSLPVQPEWTGVLAPNNHLHRAVRLYEDELLGPESIVCDGEYLYTGTADGKILEIYKGEMRVLTKLGTDPCGRFEDEPTCGRPLGMRLNKDGYLIVVDAYLGLFMVNVATGDKTVLWPSTEPINGVLPKFLNDIEIGPDGLIYLTESSTKWQRRYNRYAVWEGETSGRLLVYRPESGTMDELVLGLAFPNGVQLMRDKKHLLIASTTKAAVYKYCIEGANKGKLEVLHDNLPGFPDNIRRSSMGGYWVGMAVVRKPAFSMLDFASQRPWLRKLLAKLIPQEAIVNLIPKYGMLIHLNEQGEITKSLHDPAATKVPSVSEVEEKDGVLYLGSYYLPFLSKIYLADVKKS